MKNILCLLITCFIAITTYGQYGTNWKSLQLKGKIKSLKTAETYRYKKKGVFTEWAKSYSRLYNFDKTGNSTDFQEWGLDGALSYKMQYQYKPKEKKTEVSYFDKELKPTSKTIYLFDNKGHKTEELQYTKTDSLRWRYTYTYDEKSNNTETICYKPDGELKSIIIRTYDNKGNVTGYLLKTPGYANSFIKYVYDDKGNMTEETWLDGKNAVSFRFIRTYDDKGNKIKEVKYKGESTTAMDTVTWKYEYDKAGNWIKRTESTSDGTDFHIEDRIITYYQ